MEYLIQFQKLFVIGKRKWLFVVGLVAITYFLCQSLMLPYGNALHSLLPNHEAQKETFPSRQSYARSIMLADSLIINTSLFDGRSKNAEKYNVGGDIGDDNSTLEGEGLDNDLEFVEDTNIDNEFPLEQNANDGVIEVANVRTQENITTLVASPVVDVDSLSNTNFVKNPKVLLSTSSSDSSIDKSSIIKDENHLLLRSDFSASINDSEVMSKPVKKKMR